MTDLAGLGQAADEVLAPLADGPLRLRLARWSARWLDRSDPFRAEAEARLPASTGFHRAMIRRALDETFGALVEPALPRLAGIRAGARTTLVVAAGAIPDPIVRTIYRALLGRSAVLVKAARAEPVLPDLLARSLAAIDPGLGRCLVATVWAGGDRAVEDPVVAAVDRIVAFGEDRSVDDLRRRVGPGVDFVGRGHRISLAVVGAGALRGPEAVEDLGRRLALDAALYDQAGCLSPVAALVEEGGAVEVERLAASIADHLGRLATRLPAGALDAGRALRVHEERARGRMAGRTVLGPDDLSWPVALEDGPALRPPVRARFLPVHRIATVADLAPALAALPLQAVAVAPIELGGRLGLDERVRICPPGTLQLPPVEWLER